MWCGGTDDFPGPCSFHLSSVSSVLCGSSMVSAYTCPSVPGMHSLSWPEALYFTCLTLSPAPTLCGQCFLPWRSLGGRGIASSRLGVSQQVMNVHCVRARFLVEMGHAVNQCKGAASWVVLPGLSIGLISIFSGPRLEEKTVVGMAGRVQFQPET